LGPRELAANDITFWAGELTARRFEDQLSHPRASQRRSSKIGAALKAMRSVCMHPVATRSAADARRLEPRRLDKNIFRLLRDHGVEAAHHSGQGDSLLGIGDD